MEPTGAPPEPGEARFELVRELGRGAMGSVHLGRERATGRHVALKMIAGPVTGRRLERFLREGAVTAALDHPGIVRVHSCGALGGRLCLVYELVEGCRTLREVAPELDLRARVALVRDAARALGHAHRQGVLHRDVKPDNLLVDGAGRLRVADFGLAASAGLDRLTRTGELLGTPSYMAPEQLDPRRGRLDPTSDVWALGVVLYEVLTGRLPFAGGTLQELMVRVSEGAAVPPSRLVRDAPRGLDAVCRRALAPDPADRPADGEALAEALTAVLEGRAGRRGARGRAAAAVALVAVAGVGVAVAVAAGRPADGPRAAAASPAPASPAAPAEGAAAAEAEEAPAERTRRHLLAGRAGEARAALADVPAGDPARRLLEVWTLLLEERPAAAQERAVAALGRSEAAPELRRLWGLACLEAGDPTQAAKALEGTPEAAWVELEEARRSVTDALGGRRSGDGLTPVRVRAESVEVSLDRLAALVADAAVVLPPGEPLARPQARRVQATAADFLWDLAAPVEDDEVDGERVADLAAAARALDPLGAHVVRLAEAWIDYHLDPFDDADRRELVTADPRGWDRLLERPEQRFLAHGLWLALDPSPERLPSADAALAAFARVEPGLDTLGAIDLQRARRDVLVGAGRARRALAVAAFGRSDRVAGERELEAARELGRRGVARALEVAEDRIRLGTGRGRSWHLRAERVPDARAQLALTHLAGGDVAGAAAGIEPMAPSAVRSLLEAEAALVAGRLADARAALDAAGPAAPVEADVVRAHLRALEGDAAGARAALARARRPAERALLGVDWHAPGGAGEAVVLGDGWWPGR